MVTNLKTLATTCLAILMLLGALVASSPVAWGQDDPFPADMEIDFGQEIEGLDLAGGGEPDAAAFVAIFAFYGCSLLVAIGIQAVLAYLLSGALKVVPESYREISPGVAWLLLIPLVNIVIMFLVFIKIPRSQSKYLASIGNSSHGDCGEQMGLIGSICMLIPCINVVGLVLLIISLVKIMGAKQAILSSGGGTQEAATAQ